MSRFNSMILGLTLVAFTAGCSEQKQTPTITAVSPLEFKAYNCKQIGKEMARTTQMLEQHEQDSAAGNVLGAALAVYAVSRGHGVSFGDDEQTVHLKSKYEALHLASIEKNCD